jgi:hypothetical protein
MFHAVESADIYDVMEGMQEPPQAIYTSNPHIEK